MKIPYSIKQFFTWSNAEYLSSILFFFVYSAIISPDVHYFQFALQDTFAWYIQLSLFSAPQIILVVAIGNLARKISLLQSFCWLLALAALVLNFTGFTGITGIQTMISSCTVFLLIMLGAYLFLPKKRILIP